MAAPVGEAIAFLSGKYITVQQCAVSFYSGSSALNQMYFDCDQQIFSIQAMTH